jgi:hypothetical protein
MKKLNERSAAIVEKSVRADQEKADLSELQGWIDSGVAWQLEGAVGREAMRCLADGRCFLPKERHRDYWGNVVPSRDDVQPGTKGSLELSAVYWSCHEFLEQHPV